MRRVAVCSGVWIDKWCRVELWGKGELRGRGGVGVLICSGGIDVPLGVGRRVTGREA